MIHVYKMHVYTAVIWTTLNLFDLRFFYFSFSIAAKMCYIIIIIFHLTKIFIIQNWVAWLILPSTFPINKYNVYQKKVQRNVSDKTKQYIIYKKNFSVLKRQILLQPVLSKSLPYSFPGFLNDCNILPGKLRNR